MADLFSKLFQNVGRPVARPGAVRWLDTTPVDSTDVPCEVSSLDVRARVLGVYAQVVQTIQIANPNQRALSVALEVPLPDRATVCGYALDVDGAMVDGVVVAKEQARVVFETEQRRGADPGLVEAVKGNVYSTRVYPVPAGGSRTVRLRYVAPLVVGADGSAALDLPMPGEHLARRTLRIDVEALDGPDPVVEGLAGEVVRTAASCWSMESEELDFTPSAPVRVGMPALAPTLALLERDDEGTVWFSASSLAVAPDVADAPEIASLTVLWDASGSRGGADHARELELLRAYCPAAAAGLLRLVVFADRVREIAECADADELVAKVQAVRYDGGTSFAALSREMGELADGRAGGAEAGAFVLFTDGIDTLCGEAPVFPDGCDVLAVVGGAARDFEAMRQACRGLAFDLDTAPQDSAALARALAQTSAQRFLDVVGEGIADVCDAAAPGSGRRAAIGRLVGERAEVRLGDGGPVLALSAADARAGNVLASAWAAQKVAQLAPRAAENAEELLALGRRFGVVSPVTSLLVLETLEQWLEHDIEPPETLPDMRARWRSAQEGKMVLVSQRALEGRHRRDLAREWAGTLEWWERDYQAPDPATVATTPRFCPACGASLVPGGRFCANCGSPVAGAGPGSDSTGALPVFEAAPMEPSMGGFAPQAMMGDFGALPTPGVFQPDSMMGAPAPMAAMAMASAPMAAPMEGDAMVDGFSPVAAMGGRPAEDRSATAPDGPSMSVSVRPWMPDAPYLKALDEALDAGIGAARAAYLDQRGQFSASPSFFLDCAGWFMAHDDGEFGVGVLTNLAELRIEDAALLRVMGWRLREAGRLEQALVVFRRVLGLRPEDGQSHRDLALVLDELAREAFADGREDDARAYAEEAGELYRAIALTPWPRRALAIGLFAVEEYNVLRAWADAQTWKEAPDLAAVGPEFEGVPDCDLRITLAWDADETDVDIHVTEPSGEEAFYGHRLTSGGGRVSEDITDGYGPELYEVRNAQEGSYAIRAHYYASHQQAVFGPTTCTLTVYTDWGRPTQAQHVTSTRLDKERQMIAVGTATYGTASDAAEGSASDNR